MAFTQDYPEDFVAYDKLYIDLTGDNKPFYAQPGIPQIYVSDTTTIYYMSCGPNTAGITLRPYQFSTSVLKTGNYNIKLSQLILGVEAPIITRLSKDSDASYFELNLKSNDLEAENLSETYCFINTTNGGQALNCNLVPSP